MAAEDKYSKRKEEYITYHYVLHTNKMEDNDYNRPRRPNADTISYLKSLPFNEMTAHKEIEDYVNKQKKQAETDEDIDDNVDYPQNLSAAISALDEIQNEVASLAGDEFGSQCLETITRIVAPYSSVSVRKLLNGISGYLVHLSTHRFGSHVVQTILQNVLRGKHNLNLNDQEICVTLEIDQENEDEANPDLPSMKDLLINISEEVMSVSKELAVHICGSHVLRSLICLLGGVEEDLPSHLLNKGGSMEGGGNRRGKLKGKKKKKKKKIVDTEASSGTLNSASFANYKIVKNTRFDINDSKINDCFFSFISELTGMDFKNLDEEESAEVGGLQQLACNPSAGPLLIVILRVLTVAFGSTISKKSSSDSTEKDDEKRITEFRLGITKEQIYFEEDSFAERMIKRILCWDDSIKDNNKQKQSGEIIFGMSGEARGSHMLETVLRTSNDVFFDQICQAGRFLDSNSFTEYVEHNVSNFVIQTVLNTVRNRSQAESAIKCVEGIVNNGYVLDARNKRRGIFWRVCEMAAKFRVGQETLLKCMRKGFNTLNKKDNEIEKEEQNSIEIVDCIPLLIRYQAPEKDGGRIFLDAAGARTIYHLLRFVPRLCPDILDGIISRHKAEELVSICSDGLGSRCIIDGILEGSINQAPFAKAIKQLFDKLKGHLTTLAVDRVGHHTVRNLFMRLKSYEDKALISAELSKSIRTLDGNAMGRSIISQCALREYMGDEDVWRSTVKKAVEKESFLKEITEGDVTNNTKKRKRKRKKKENEENTAKAVKVGDNTKDEP